jgi:hypothetical protein
MQIALGDSYGGRILGWGPSAPDLSKRE